MKKILVIIYSAIILIFCGFVTASFGQTCIKNAKLCPLTELCYIATTLAKDANDGFEWTKVEQFQEHVKEAKKRKLYCGVKSAFKNELVTTTKRNEKYKLWSNEAVCIEANFDYDAGLEVAHRKITCDLDLSKMTGDQICYQLFLGNSGREHLVDEKKRRGLLCKNGKQASTILEPLPDWSSQETNAQPKFKTCQEQPSNCTPAKLCSKATRTSGGKRMWETGYYLKHANEAKRLGLTCGVSADVVVAKPKEKSCNDDPELCTVSELCQAATIIKNGTKTWASIYTTKPYVELARSWGLTCGIITKKTETKMTSSEVSSVQVRSTFDETTAERIFKSSDSVDRKTIQSILAQNSLYKGNIDAAWGKQTKSGLKMAFSRGNYADTRSLFDSLLQVAKRNGTYQEMNNKEKQLEQLIFERQQLEVQLSAFQAQLDRAKKLQKKKKQMCIASCLRTVRTSSGLEGMGACGWKCTSDEIGIDITPTWAKRITRKKYLDCQIDGNC